MTCAHQVQRQAIVREHDDEEGEVDEEVQHVRQQLQVEHVHALRLPAPLRARVHRRQRVLHARRDQARRLHVVRLRIRVMICNEGSLHASTVARPYFTPVETRPDTCALVGSLVSKGSP